MLLEAAVRAPDTRLADLPLMVGVERRRLLVEWNDTHTPIAPVTVQALFEAQAVRTRSSTDRPEAAILSLSVRTSASDSLSPVWAGMGSCQIRSSCGTSGPM